MDADVAAQIAALERQLQIAELQAQIEQLQGAAPAPVSSQARLVKAAPDPVPVAQVAPDPAPLVQAAPDPAPLVQAAPDIQAQIAEMERQLEKAQLKAEIAQLQGAAPPQTAVPQPPPIQAVPDPAPLVQAAPDPAPLVQAVPDTVTAAQQAVPSAAKAASFLPDLPEVPLPLLGVLALPLGYFAVRAFVEFINSRYDELQAAEAERSAFPAPSPGNVLANQRWSEREANAEAMRASSWDDVPGGRSAPDIFFGALSNLASEPTGWLFGPPSALYSTLPVAPPQSAAEVVPPSPTFTPTDGVVVPASRPEYSSARAVRRQKAKPPPPRSPRVPPQTPEELEMARRGEWDYGQSAE